MTESQRTELKIRIEASNYREVAKQIGIDHSTLHNVVNKNQDMKLSTLRKIEDYLK